MTTEWPPDQGSGPDAPGPPGRWSTNPPPPLTGYLPAPLPPRRSGAVWAVVLIAGFVAVGLLFTLAPQSLDWLPTPGGGVRAPLPSSRGPEPTVSVPTSTASPTPTTGPTLPTDAEDLLKNNPIYKLKVPAACPPQQIPRSRTAFRLQVKALVSCENKAWAKALAKLQGVFSKPKVKFYTSSTKSPCGQLGVRFPASYCNSNETLYFSDAAYLQGRYYRLSVAGFVFHEYAHHVQALTKILEASWWPKDSAAVVNRRIELQAHCIAHYQLTHAGVDFSSADRREIERQFNHTNDAKGHGSTTAERYWGRRGFGATTIGACDTWSAKAAKVK